MGDRNLAAVAPADQDAVLGLSKVRDADRQPDAEARQQQGDQRGGCIHRHAVAIVIGFAVIRVACEVVGQEILCGCLL